MLLLVCFPLVVNLDSDSEEEAVVMMEPEQMDTPSKSKSK